MRHPAPPHVICSVRPERAEQALSQIERAPAGCALVELRADRLKAEEIAGIVRRAGRPLVVTVRRAGDGGAFDGAEDERSRALEAALEAGAAFVDLEWNRPVASLADLPAARGRTILSDHGAPCRIAELRSRFEEMTRRGPAVVKIAAAPADVDEILALRALLAEQARAGGPPLAAFGLGVAGTPSRLLAPLWGSWATYGSLEAGAETGPGQLTAAEMLERYDVLAITERTRLNALLGGRIAGSPSPAMHLAGYRALGLDARYLAVETDDLGAFDRLIDPERGLAVGGFGVTMPFKEAVARRSTAGDELVRRSGAANTVLAGRAGWTGYNTDGPAALACVRRHLEPRGARVVVLGAGGTARAVAAALVGEGARVTLVNRTLSRAEEAARACGAGFSPESGLGALVWDVLVHATPRGSGGERFLAPDLLSGRVVLDAVYGPVETALVRDARERGLAAIGGLELLAAQAALQFRLLTGRAVEPELLRCTATAWIRDHRLDAPEGRQ